VTRGYHAWHGLGLTYPRLWIEQLEDLWLFPRLVDECRNLFANVCIVLVNKAEQELSIPRELLVHLVFDMTTSTWKVTFGVLLQLLEDPFDGTLSILRGNVGVNALVAQIVYVRSEIFLLLLHVVKRRRNLCLENG